ncbi:MAG TPA: hypothetical protein VFB81_21135 [Myxococcales bacterium]|nr:hypothetical protein [Myxococcales bacterium]
MKTIVKGLVLVGVAAVLTGCGESSTRNMLKDQRTEVFEVRMLGQDRGDLSSALLSVASVTASTRGQPLEVEPVVDTMDLTQTRQAWLLARVRVPEGAPDVDFSVLFDDAGGYESAGGNGWVESRGMAIAWRAPVGWLQRNGHVVIHMDLGRSLVPHEGAMRLIPNAVINY